MSDNGSEQKKYQYMVTMRWYVETDEELVAGAADTDEKLLEIVRHRKDGSKIVVPVQLKIMKVMPW
jgi:hypothetical protein